MSIWETEGVGVQERPKPGNWPAVCREVKDYIIMDCMDDREGWSMSKSPRETDLQEDRV